MENITIEMIVQLIGIVVLIYEFLSRIIPSVKDWTIVGNIIKFLRWLSDYLNNLKSKENKNRVRGGAL